MVWSDLWSKYIFSPIYHSIGWEYRADAPARDSRWKARQQPYDSTLTAPHTTVSNIHILSLVGESGIIELNGTVQIDANISQVKGHILEDNIFLGSKGNIRWIPSLLVHSDDVEAGHAARIERVSDEKLYYLRARGIPKDDATVMMIESAVSGLFEGLDEKYQEEIEEKITKIF
jgi:Fe-S cluster assembly protein SufB